MISTIRHDEVFKAYEFRQFPIHIVGAGATGSRVFAALVELGLTNITVYDDDVVETHNLANQIYLAQNLGEFKVDALMEFFHDKTGTQETLRSDQFINRRVPFEGWHPEGLLFLLTDTMKSRTEIIDYIVDQNCPVEYVFETRMASSYGNVFCFRPGDSWQVEKWADTLIDDDAAETSACGTSITVGPTAAIIANLAVWQMINYLTDYDNHEKRTNVYFRPFIMATGDI